ncbi:estrogen receptor-like [Ostrinia furnacalis]|uniref:estrogen receptor-like n=1 Tax=Ostrinia furnacalis TaxID=93504 RepID=UPI001038CDEA|nr:estrogen receptor-like [Ostrinia furnacalis]
MELWSGLPAASLRPVSDEGFALAFFDPKPDAPPKQEQQYAADSASGGAKAAAPCKVCGDKASGYHYGVTSCEGCKLYVESELARVFEK